MTRAIRTLVAGTGLLAVVACNNDKLTELNKNPNSPEDVPATTLFTFATQRTVGRFLGSGYVLRGAGLLIQHVAQVQYPDEDSYSRLTGGSTTTYFDNPYVEELEDYTKVIAKGDAASDPGTSGPAQVMRTWAFSYLTNTFGDIPYMNALAGDSIGGSLAPTYDPQLTIYTDLFARLAAASTALGSASNSLGTSDPIYDGNPASWQRFANSLRARLALNLVNQNPTLANTQLTAALSAPGGIITSNANNAKLAWPGDGLYDNPWAVNFQSRDDHRLSKTFIDVLASTADPRVVAFADPAQKDTVSTPFISKYCPGGISPCYVGLQNALTQAQAGPYIPYTSRPDQAFYPGVTAYGTIGGSGASFPSFVFTAAEGNFILAEAAERGIGGIAGGAAQAKIYYDAAIRASMNQWGITDVPTQDAFINSANVSYLLGATQAARLTRLAIQKWVALYTDGGTAWTEWRRTCQPNTIAPGPNAINATVPRRFQYSSTEYSVNKVNVQAAVTAQGADDFDSRAYFDKSPTAAPTYPGAGNCH